MYRKELFIVLSILTGLTSGKVSSCFYNLIGNMVVRLIVLYPCHCSFYCTECSDHRMVYFTFYPLQ